MIIGGTSSAGKCGNLRTGYSQKFIPCQAYLLSETIRLQLQRNRNLVWSAYVQIEDLTGTLITVKECSYLQVQKQLIGGMETASITVEKPELWSIWGLTYPEVLRPSKRKLKIYAGIKGSEVLVYTGRITSVTETRGSDSLGAININCSDYRSILNKEQSTQLPFITSRYYEIFRLCKNVFDVSQQMICINDQDTSTQWYPTGDSYKATDGTISGQPAWSMGQGTVVIAGNRQQNVIGRVLEITDAHINWATRTFADGTAYNAAVAVGLNNSGEVEQVEVTDPVDIAKRGKIVYTQNVGSDADNLDDMITFAQDIIAKALQGSFSLTLTYNPYLLPGQIVKFSSTRFNIPVTYARLNAVRMQYQYGNATTAIDALELL